MKKQILILAAGVVVAGAQTATLGPIGQQFQEPGTMGVVVRELPGRGAIVTGSPISAKEVRKTVQTLSDGTQIENSSTTLFYRDSLGRTRTEPQREPITIVDPVAGLRYQVNVAQKTATRIPMPGAGGRAGGRAEQAPAQAAELEAKLKEAAALREDVAGVQKAAQGGVTEPKSEDLGFQSQNGVMAQGTRITRTIPQGQIGNSRDIHVVNERWYSKELQLMVKTMNSDPRFGVTTYELTDIVQAQPDATLFQVPAGYTVKEMGGGRGGR